MTLMGVSTDRVICNLKRLRREKGYSQSQLAELAGVRRQAIYDMESGRYVPNTAVALKMARHLGCRVEDLFAVEEQRIERPITLLEKASPSGSRVCMARVGDRLVGYPLDGTVMLNDGLQAADGLITSDGGSVRLLRDEAHIEKTALILGCDPAFSILSSHVARCNTEARIHYRFSSSLGALDGLASGVAHLAGTHLHDTGQGDSNIVFARNTLPNMKATVLAFSFFEEGLMVAPGNPRGIRTVADLAGERIRFVNREKGAALRILLDERLVREGIPAEAIDGYGNTALSHTRGAQMVVYDLVDAALGLRAIASAYGLDFVPLETVRCDLVVPCDFLDHPAVKVVLDVLQTHAFREELASLPGYDSSCTGRIICTV